MKEGDKFINIGAHKDMYEHDYINFHIYTVEKFSKDGKKIRAIGNKVFEAEDKGNLASMQDFRKAITELKTKAMCKHFVIQFTDYPLGYKFGDIYPATLREDEFDETVHIHSAKDDFTVEENLVKNSAFCKIREKNTLSYWLVNGIEGLVAFFSEKADFSTQTESTLLEKFNNWQERFGFDKTDELWLDFKGGTAQLEWAIDNNIDCSDYDRWQCLQKILKHELKYETANEMLNTLYDKEDIEIFDCK